MRWCRLWRFVLDEGVRETGTMLPIFGTQGWCPAAMKAG
jgi:hypothetical protein